MKIDASTRRQLSAAIAGLVLTFIGLVLTAHSIHESRKQMAVTTATDLRMHLADAARRITKESGADAISFDFDNMLHMMDAHIKDVQTLGTKLHNESFLRSTLITVAKNGCPAVQHGGPISDCPRIQRHKVLAGWASSQDLRME